jgi:Protein of unknown function (DUF3558)
MARRVLACLAAALTAAFTAALLGGCVQTVAGQGTFAGGTAGPDSTEVPTGTGSPSAAPSEDDTGRVCAALDRQALQRLIGAPVELTKSQSSGCQLTGSNGKSMIVAVFDYLTLNEYKKGRYRELRVGGHPAVSTDSNVIYVARSSHPDDDGLLAAYFSGLGDNGDRIAVAVLQQLLTKFSR